MLKRYFVSIIWFLVLASVYPQNIEKNVISINELKERIINDSTLVILDVRTPEELTGPLGKLEKVINIPVQELENRLSELEKFRNREIAVICKIGKRSATATDFLLQNGFNAKNVLGGMIEYRAKTENSPNSKE